MKNPPSQIRYDNVDVLKSICSLLVICIHIKYADAEIGAYIKAVSGIAVPIFFMITGFFYTQSSAKGAKPQIIKILKLYLQANVLFFLFGIFTSVFGMIGKIGNIDHVLDYLTKTVTIENVEHFILYNESPFSQHLWYLGAILYVLVIALHCDKQPKFWKLLYILTPLLILGNHSLGKYSHHMFGKQLPTYMIRNFLFRGIPYFCIGKLIYEYLDSIRHVYQKHSILLWCLSGLCLPMILIEHDCIANHIFEGNSGYYLSTIATSLLLFSIAVSSPPENMFVLA